MNKRLSFFAIAAFLIFCLFMLSYDTQFIAVVDQAAFDLLYGNETIAIFHSLGATKVIIAVTFVLAIFAWFRFRKIQLVLFILVTVGLGYYLNQILKQIIERPRPEFLNQFTSFSFPSGHAMVGLLYLFTIAYVLGKTVSSIKVRSILWIIAAILILFIGLSRIAEGHHYASDIFAGWMLGCSWFTLCVKLYEISFKRNT